MKSGIPSLKHRSSNSNIPSLNTLSMNAYAKEQNKYTGSEMIGVATMHKSNAVPVFSEEAAKDISNMRR